MTPTSLESTIVFPEPPALIRSGGVRGAIRLFGPGAIIASVTIGSGETLFASRAGAIFGYRLLWFIAVCVACKLVQVYTGARYMVLTGEHPMEAWARLPGPRGWFPAAIGVLSVLCFPFWLGGLALMLGTAINWIVGLDAGDAGSQRLLAQLFATASLVVAAVLAVLQSYSVLEKVQTAIVAVLLVSILAAVGFAPVDWAEAIRNTVVPSFPEYQGWMYTDYPRIVTAQSVMIAMTIFMGAIGGGPYDYIGYLSMFREKAWGAISLDARTRHETSNAGKPPPGEVLPARDGQRASGSPVIERSGGNLARGRQWLRAPIIDTFTAFGCVLIFSMAFNILGAAILHPRHEVPDEFALLTPQVHFLTQIHSSLKYVYQAGIFMAFWGTIYGAFEIYSRTVYECFRPLCPGRPPAFGRFRLPVCLYAGAGGILLVWKVADPLAIVTPAALVGTLTCGLWCFAMIWADRDVLPHGLRMGRLWIALNVASGVTMTGFGAAAISNCIR